MGIIKNAQSVDPRQSNIPSQWAEFPSYREKSGQLNFFTWCILYRLAWLIGFSKNSETLKSTKKRAKESALYLNELMTKQSSLCLIAHGIINKLIAKNLVKTGW